MAIGAGGVIDQFFVALGYRIDPAGARQVKQNIEQAKEGLLSLGTAVKAFVIGSAIKSVAQIGSTFEQNTTAIAAMLATLGKSSDFNAGLLDAEETLARITTDAAKLPGEAEDYIEVFRAGLPALVDAMPGASAEQIAAFTNRLTAIGTSILQVDPAQLGRDLQLMLGPIGRAGAQVRTFAQLLGYLRRLPGQANLTAEAFNRMSQPERLRLIQETLGNENLTAALDHAADSFDAMWGAAVSGLKQFVREASKGAFKQMKVGLHEITSLFIDDKGHLTAFGQSIADTGRMVLGWIGQILAAGGGIAKWLVTSEAGALALKVAFAALGVVLTGLALAKTVEMFSKLSKLLLNPKLLLIGALAILIALVAEDLYMFFTNGKSVVGLLKDKFPAAFYVVTSALTAAIGLFVALKVAAVASAVATAIAWGPVLVPILLVLGAIGLLIVAYKKFPAFAAFVDRIANGFVVMADAIERAVNAMKEFLGLNTHESDAFKRIADGGSFDSRVGVNDNAGEPTFLQRPATTTGASSVTNSVVTNSGKQVQVHVDRPHVVIQTNDPQKMGEEFHRQVTRNAQKAYR